MFMKLEQKNGEIIQGKVEIVQVEHANLALVSRKDYLVRKKLTLTLIMSL